MGAQRFQILDKVREGPGTVRPGDFVLGPPDPVEVDLVLRSPDLSLYCVDPVNGAALFVEAPGGDFSGAPFLYVAQYEAARHVVSIPLEDFHRLADEVEMPDNRIALVYSVGRCGSTLVSHAFGAIPRVASLSEPDAVTQLLGMWGLHDLVGSDKEQMIRSCARLQCAPSRLGGATAWALKFRSMVTVMGPLFHRVMPEAKVVFIYRNLVPWAQSFMRMIGCADPTEAFPLARPRPMFGLGMPDFGEMESITAIEFTAGLWATTMRAALEMIQADIPVFSTRYEDLTAHPERVLEAMFAFCGFGQPGPEDMRRVLAQDSQEGSFVARSALAERLTLSPDHVQMLHEALAERAPGLTADARPPGALAP